MAEAAKDLSNLTFEAAMKELEGIVRRLESGQADLESSIADYQQGMKLKEYCEKKLADAKLKVETIMKAPDGSLATKPADTLF